MARKLSDSRDYAHVVLFRDNLERILTACRKLDESDHEVTLSGLSWSTTDVEELREKEGSEPLTSLEIGHHFADGYLHLEMRPPLGVRLYIDDVRDPIKRGVFEEIHHELKRAQRPLPVRMLLSPLAGGVYLGACLMGLVGAVVGGARGQWAGMLLGLLIAAVSGTAARVSIHMGMKRSALVHLVWREERPGFTQRTEDQIAVALIAAVVGAVLGAAGMYVVTVLT